MTTSWDRQVAWLLACQTFKDDERFRHWVVTDLQNEHPLTLYSAAEIPREWGTDPALRHAVIDYIKRQGSNTVSEGQIHALSALVPCDETRDALLECVDSWRPSWIIDALIRDYPTDPKVREEIEKRFELEPEKAAKYAFVAVKILGFADGFAFLERVARSGVSEAHLAAMALAAAWSDCRVIAETDIDTGEYQPEQVEEAAQILTTYDAAHLAEMCLQSTSERELHCSAEIIRAWPQLELVRQRAKRLLDTAEARPAPVIEAYADLDDADSQALLLEAFSQLGYLEPALREFIASELGSHSHDTLVLSEILLDEWVRDYDRGASRASVMALSQSVKRSLALEATSDRGTRLREVYEILSLQIGSEMTALGTELEEHRQVAWIAMLITQNFELLGSAYERRRSDEPARVQLQNHYGETDIVLAGLVAQNWEALEHHCGETISSRFGSIFGEYDDPAAERRAVVSNLAAVATSYPKVANMIRTALSDDEELRRDSRVVQWLAGTDEESLRALLSSTSNSLRQVRPSEIDQIGTTEWQLSKPGYTDWLAVWSGS
jgi:hypothetical protein